MTSSRSRLVIVAPFDPFAGVVPVSVVVVVGVSVVLVPVLDAEAAGDPSACASPCPRAVSVWTVSGAFGWNVLTLVAPMSPCATTVLIACFAQSGGCEAELVVEPVAAAARKAATITAVANVASFRPTFLSSTREAAGITLVLVNLEITPEPDDAERAAIAAALAAEEAEKEQARPSRWSKGVLPVHDAHDEPHP